MSEKILAILERARWAPSGDNCQPWAFQFLDEFQIRIHVFHNPENVYEWGNGKPSWISVGALIENIRLAAAPVGMVPEVSTIHDITDGKGYVDVLFLEKETHIDPLEAYIESRTVTRTPFRIKDLSGDICADLTASVGPDFVVEWHRGFWGKWNMIRINGLATQIRLMIREAFAVHKAVIDWDRQMSPDKIPAVALGFSRLNLFFTKWAMTSWARVDFMNRFCAGAIFPQIELDLLPGIFCARHFRLFRVAKIATETPADLLAAGAAMQRLWLTATHHGLSFQPGMAPLIFASYAKDGAAFSDNSSALKKAKKLYGLMKENTAYSFDQQVFQGRIGYTASPCVGRSVRKPLSEMIVSGQ